MKKTTNSLYNKILNCSDIQYRNVATTLVYVSIPIYSVQY